jgi:hypothetical protein
MQYCPICGEPFESYDLCADCNCCFADCCDCDIEGAPKRYKHTIEDDLRESLD